jgi:DNA phosphorothioation-dependent restriction protein DptH
MTFDHLARIIGEKLAQLTDLRAVVLPQTEGVYDRAAEIARTANKNHRHVDGEVFSVIVGDPLRTQTLKDVLVIPKDKTISYRLNNRLFVFTERATALASIDKATSIVLDENFPSGAQSPISVREISQSVVAQIASLSKGNVIASGEDSLRIIENCLNTLIEAHKTASRTAAIDWNSLWWDHVNHGIQNLHLIFSKKIETDPNLSFSSFFERYAFASFGLPKPASKGMYKGKIIGIGKDIDDAMSTWWTDLDSVHASFVHINRRSEIVATGGIHPLSALDWSEFESAKAALDSGLLAFATLFLGDVSSIEAFAEFTEAQFFYPPENILEDSSILIFDESGEKSRKIPFNPPKSNINVITPSNKSLVSDTSATSEELTLVIPTFQVMNSDQLGKSAIKIITSSKALTWSGSFSISEDRLVAKGHFKLNFDKDSYKNFHKPFRIKVDCQRNDVANSYLDEKSTASFLFSPLFGSALFVSEPKGASKYSTFSYLGPISADDTETSFAHSVQDGSKEALLLALGENCTIDASVLEPHPEFNSLFAASSRVTNFLNVNVGDSSFMIRSESKAEEIESPILAAIDCSPLTIESPTSANRNTIRGLLEDFLADEIENASFLSNNFHIALPIENFASEKNGDFTAHAGFVIPTSQIPLWNASVDCEVELEFLTSDVSVAFREAFQALEIPKSLRQRNLIASTSDWVSRTSWRHLWVENRTQLDAYLYAYEALVAEARNSCNPATIFWASYPFSASIWDLQDTGTCQGVLLSPLHPIRMAWLASVERTIWESENSGNLVGTVEGWNFPVIGPSPTKNGSLIALPTDSGDGQLFAGWGYLVNASIDGPEALNAPVQIAGLPSPGSAASGMNSSSALSALKDYRRVNPHITTLTIDLASGQEATRLDEIDEAVLGIAKRWTSMEAGTLPGGIRVWDSLNRIGEAPIDDTQAIIADGVDSPLVWTRYKNRVGESKKCNVRFLQDSGLRIEVEPKGNERIGSANLGLIGSIPLRRFEAHSGKTDESNRSYSFPTLGQSQSSSTFYQALRTLENATARPSIKAQLFKALLVDENADWTVSGESMISPGSIASLLDHGAAQKMLWEWRPPFFDAGQKSALEQRPFISIARIPQSFKIQLESFLTRAMSQTANQNDVDLVLSKLGSRGVGLSSLLAIGGTHAAGALGFYLALSLLDIVEDETVDHFVMPIDACDGFLKALGSSNSPSTITNRADLLLMSIRDNSLTFTPIEIKFYGLDSNNPAALLPSYSDRVLDKAKQQVSETKVLIDNLIGEGLNRSAQDTKSSYSLWLNALSTLVEASIKLSPKSSNDPSRLRNRMQSLVDGSLILSSGKPLITFFGHQAKAKDGGDYHLEQAGELNGTSSTGLLSINTSFALENVHSKNFSIDFTSRWLEMIEWASLGESNQKLDGAPESPEVPASTSSESEPSTSGLADKEPEQSLPTPQPEALHEEEGVLPPTSEPPTVVSRRIREDIGSWPESDGVRITVGTKADAIGSSSIDFWPANTLLTHMNMGVVGNLGTGKTQFLLSTISQLRNSAKEVQDNKLSMLIFDYKKDYQKDDFISDVGGKVLSPDKGIPLNVLALHGEYTETAAVKKAQAFCDVIAKIYPNVGPIQKENLTLTIIELFSSNANNRAPSLKEVLELYKTKSGKADAVTGVLNKFVMPKTFIEDQTKLLSFEELMEDSVVVVSLSDFGADTETKNTLVVLFLDLYFGYMSKLTKWPPVGENPKIRKLNSFLLVDEATNIMQYDFPILKQLLLEGREFGVGTILSSQYLNHFKTKGMNYAEALNTWMIHQVPAVNANQLVSLGLPNADESIARQITQFEPHVGYYSSHLNRGIVLKGQPYFSLFE